MSAVLDIARYILMISRQTKSVYLLCLVLSDLIKLKK